MPQSELQKKDGFTYAVNERLTAHIEVSHRPPNQKSVKLTHCKTCQNLFSFLATTIDNDSSSSTGSYTIIDQ